MATEAARILNRTKEQRKADIQVLIAMPLKQLRKHQELAEKQIKLAFDQKNDEALASLQMRADDLTIAVWNKTWPNEPIEI